MTAIQREPSLRGYRVDGRLLPTVTGCLWPIIGYKYSGVAAEAAARTGTEVHRMLTGYHQTGAFPETSDPMLQPYLDSWLNWYDAAGFVPEYINQTMAHAELGYAGTADMVGFMKEIPVVVDWKTGQEERWHAAQLAGYEMLVQGQPFAQRDQRFRHQFVRIAVYLDPDGGPPVAAMHTNEYDRGLFLACLNIEKFWWSTPAAKRPVAWQHRDLQIITEGGND